MADLPMQRVLENLEAHQRDWGVEVNVEISTSMRIIYGVMQRLGDGLVWLRTNKAGRLHVVSIAHIVSVQYTLRDHDERGAVAPGRDRGRSDGVEAAAPAPRIGT